MCQKSGLGQGIGQQRRALGAALKDGGLVGRSPELADVGPRKVDDMVHPVQGLLREDLAGHIPHERRGSRDVEPAAAAEHANLMTLCDQVVAECGADKAGSASHQPGLGGGAEDMG